MKYQHLLGKPFAHGKTDCYSLVREFYRDNFGMALRNYARPNDWWKNPQFALYQNLYSKEGFVPANVHPTDWKPADLILMAIKSSTANHIAIIVDDATMIHHLYGRLSCAEKLSSNWRNFTVGVIRHPDVPAITRGKTTPFMDVYRGSRASAIS